VLALRAGKSYDALVRGRIIEPLGLRDTSMDVPAEKLPRFAQGHDRRGRPVPHWDLPALPGAGALRSTGTDMLAFLELQLDEGSSPLAAAARLTHPARARMWRVHVGLGWFHYPVRGRRYEALFHDGGTGGFWTVCGFVPELRTSVVVLSNCARPVDRLGLRIVEALESQ
jgi:D-alanyl-D-alanine-carboxypeptidase/D-alanyl-D-alanine-endopeptidase